MRNYAYAVAITEENIRGVIRSEAGLMFDLDNSLKWLELYEEGWFLRDEESPFDCQFFVPEVFEEMYKFIRVGDRSLFKQVERI